MYEQDEFLFADGPQPELHLAHPLDDLLRQIATLWGLPIGSRARVTLNDPALPVLEGKLELERAPDLPLNVRESLRLKLRGIMFTSRDIASWSLLE